MTIDSMTLKALVEKGSDADFLREMIEVISNRLIEMEVEGLRALGVAHQPSQRQSRAWLGDARG